MEIASYRIIISVVLAVTLGLLHVHIEKSLLCLGVPLSP